MYKRFISDSTLNSVAFFQTQCYLLTDEDSVERKSILNRVERSVVHTIGEQFGTSRRLIYV
jgi:hypothetical protein